MAGPERFETRKLLVYWKRIRGEKRFPSSDDIDRAELVLFEPNLFELKMTDPETVTVMHVGDTLIARMGDIDICGKNLFDLFDAARVSAMQRRFQLMFDIACALCTHNDVFTAEGDELRAETLFLPVDDGPDKPRRIFGTIYYTHGPDSRNVALQDPAMALQAETFLEVGNGYAIALDGSDISRLRRSSA